MLILVTGGAASGKSEFGENVLRKYKNKLYIATMMPFGDEEKDKIHKHRLMRKDKGFDTVEIYRDIHNLSFEEKYCAVILECVSNALANEMFGCRNKKAVQSVLTAAEYIGKHTKCGVVISSEVGSDGIKYDNETMDYIKNMALLNSKIAEICDVVIEVVFGIPVFLKGEIKV